MAVLLAWSLCTLLVGIVSGCGGGGGGGGGAGAAPNAEPNAAADSATTLEDTPVVVAVLANDSDPDGDSLQLGALSAPTRGAVAPTPANEVRYTPDADFNGTDSFTYTLSDGVGHSVSGTVTITVAPVNDPPIAGDDSATTPEDTPIDIPIGANDTDVDGDILTAALTTAPAAGTVSISGTSATYTPDPDVNGSDSFEYTVTDAAGVTDSATVTVTVSPVPDAPVAVDDVITTAEDAPVTFDPRTNDSDADGDALQVTQVSAASIGTVQIDAAGTVTYTPDLDANGIDSFTVTVADPGGLTAVSSVSVTIDPVPDAPVAAPDTAVVLIGGSVEIDVLANDTDADGDLLDVASFTPPASGTVTVAPGGLLTYTPALGFVGNDSFTYTATDGTLDSAAMTVTVDVADFQFTLRAVSQVGTFDVTSGTGTIFVPVQLELTTGLPGEPTVAELDLDLTFDPALFAVSAVKEGSGLAALGGGLGPDVFDVVIEEGRVLVTVVVSSAGAETLTVGAATEILQLQVQPSPVRAANPFAFSGTVAFATGGANLVAPLALSPVEPLLVDGTVDYTPDALPIDFHFLAPGQRVPFDATTGLGSFTALCYMQEGPGAPGYPRGTSAFSAALGHDPALFTINTANPGSDLQALHGGVGPEFLVINVFPEGVTIGAIYTISAPPSSDPLPAPTPVEILSVDYDTDPAALAGAGPLDSFLTWSAALGTPPVDTVVVVAGQAVPVSAHDGVIQLRP